MPESIVLYGKGFTDAAVPELKRHKIWELYLIDTAITDAGVAELRTRIRNVSKSLESIFGLFE